MVLPLLLAFASLGAFSGSAAAQEGLSVCFLSAYGLACVERPWTGAIDDAQATSQALLAALVAGPTAEERAQGLHSAIPSETELSGVACSPSGAKGECRAATVQLHLPPQALTVLTPLIVEGVVEQVAATLHPLGWRDLRVEVFDPARREFRLLADFLPKVPAPRKETLLSGEETPRVPQAPVAVEDQPPAPGQGQPQGALSGKTVYVSAGHGWQWWRDIYTDSLIYDWRVQRIPYPRPPYVGPIIEDHNNAEVVNQYLLRYLWNAGGMVWPIRERDMNDAVLVVDDGDPGSAAGHVRIGGWTTGTIGAGYAGTDYYWTGTVTGTPTATAVWTATMPSDGRYAVYVWYRPGANRAPDARYAVHHAGGETVVTVDQAHHGLTWHYIGTYGFLGGEEARVALTNQSTVTDVVVIADAVRFGGGTFDDLAGIDTAATFPPDRPWWEMAAYYYVQRMGMGAPPRGDVTARPIYARWEHAGTGDDAVYVSWHTNGGKSHGTVSIIYNGTQVTPGSEELRDAIHAELVHDIQAGWDTGWPGLKRGMDLGELRELWDSDPAMQMPGALIEVAYHDTPEDTDALKEPSFNMLVARAMYQGIVRYFEGRDGVDLTLLPEPPTHLAVENLGGGRARVSWQPSPTDTVGLVGDAAAGYRVYTSTNGVGWSNGVAVTGVTVYTVTDLSDGELILVRVAATNDGGESFPTETLTARAGDRTGVLLVNGFDRLDRQMLVPDYYTPTADVHMRMFLDQMNRYDYAIQHGFTISHTFDSAANEAVADGLLDLRTYRVVDWILGEESWSDETLSAPERAALAGFLDYGGALFISGSELAWDLDDQGRDPIFYNTYLRADYGSDHAGTYQVVPAAGGVFDGLGSFRFDAPGEYDVDYADQITPINGSSVALTYQGGGTAAVQYTDGCERLINFGFPFETIRPAEREAVMARVIDFLDECLPGGPQTVITSPLDGEAHQAVPPVAGWASALAAVDWVDVSVRREVDEAYWDGAGWVTEPWHTAVGTVTWSFPMPPTLAVGSYEARARAWDTGGVSDTTPSEVEFTIVEPSVFLPVVLRGYRAEPRGCTDAIVDGGFESDAAWAIVDTGYLAAYTTTVVHTGARSVRVGIPADRPGGSSTTYSSISQTVTLTAGCAATLRYWVYPIYEDADDGDWAYVWLVDGFGDTHFLRTGRENLAAWVEREADLSAFAGQTVRLHFSVRNDGDDDTAVTYLDDVRVVLCPP